MGRLVGALELAEGPAAQGYPAQWWEEQIAWCAAWDATLTLYGESLGAVPSRDQPARRVLISLCLVCMHILDGWHGRGWKEYGLRPPREPSPALRANAYRSIGKAEA